MGAGLAETRYFDRLIARYERGVFVPATAFAEAKASKCHENANRYAKLHPGHAVARGWLAAMLQDEPPMFLLVAHSVLREPKSSRLIDVTPMNEHDRRMYRFLEHRGSEEEYDALKGRFASHQHPPFGLADFMSGTGTPTECPSFLQRCTWSPQT